MDGMNIQHGFSMMFKAKIQYQFSKLTDKLLRKMEINPKMEGIIDATVPKVTSENQQHKSKANV
jgi:hypothetical protein